MSETVTAIITTHNRLELLKRAIEGVKSQTYPNIELIVVNDASTDGTAEYCASNEIRCISIPKEESRGGNYARNLGIKNAKGKYIAFCDDDDCWLPNKTQQQIDLIESKNCDFVFGGVKQEFVSSRGISFALRMPEKSNCGDISKSILWTIPCVTSTLLCRRDALVKVGLFDESLRFWQEHELTIRMAQKSHTYFVNEPVIIYRVDAKDPHRLTNKYYAWKQAVKQIYNKHASLISHLTFKQRLKMKALEYADGIGRARNSGLKWEFWKNRILVKCITLFTD